MVHFHLKASLAISLEIEKQIRKCSMEKEMFPGTGQTSPHRILTAITSGK
jgi:hypothetical protein